MSVPEAAPATGAPPVARVPSRKTGRREKGSATFWSAKLLLDRFSDRLVVCVGVKLPNGRR